MFNFILVFFTGRLPKGERSANFRTPFSLSICRGSYSGLLCSYEVNTFSFQSSVFLCCLRSSEDFNDNKLNHVVCDRQSERRSKARKGAVGFPFFFHARQGVEISQIVIKHTLYPGSVYNYSPV